MEANLASPEFKEHLSESNYGSVKETSFPKQVQCLKVTCDVKFPFFKTQRDDQGDLALNLGLLLELPVEPVVVK